MVDLRSIVRDTALPIVGELRLKPLTISFTADCSPLNTPCFTMLKASNRCIEFDLIRALAIVSVVIIHAGFLSLPDRRLLFISIDTLQLFCVPAFLLLSGFFLTNKRENQNNPTLILKKRLSRIIPPYLFLVGSLLHFK
ncbi:acyltransferase [Microcoleus sp. AT9b-C3]|uniref:acyltransferase n=1 Tax=Microcoleus sp. AT9b-C3 TaxID=2818629 RepID=UPI002FD13AA4